MIDLMYLLIAIITSILSPVYTFATGSIGGGTGPTNPIELQKYYLMADVKALYKGIGGVNTSMFASVLWILPNSILNLVSSLGWTIKAIIGVAVTIFGARYINILASLLSGVSYMEAFTRPLEATTGIGAALHLDQLMNGLGVFPKLVIVPWIILAIVNWVAPVILGLIIWFSLVFVFFRIFLLLINSYIKILLAIILSPIYILFEAIPGQSAFTNWLKNLVGELITFPMVVGIFILGTIIVESASSGNLVQFPFMVGIDPESFGIIIGMILFFMTPDLVKAIRQIFIPKPGILDAAGPGVLFGGLAPAVGGVMGGMGQIGSVSLFLSGIGRSDILQGLAKKFGMGPPKVGPQTDVSGKQAS